MTMITIRQLQKDIGVWSDSTFPDHTVETQIKKLIAELNELLETPHSRSEQADCFLILLDICRLVGTDADTLIRATSEKLEINKLRTWQKLPDGTYQHVQA